jgi:hypothetical protein
MFHVELYGEFFLSEGLQAYDFSETIFITFIRRLYHTYDCVLMVSLAVYVMWLSFLFHPPATAQDGADTAFVSGFFQFR